MDTCYKLEWTELRAALSCTWEYPISLKQFTLQWQTRQWHRPKRQGDWEENFLAVTVTAKKQRSGMLVTGCCDGIVVPRASNKTAHFCLQPRTLIGAVPMCSTLRRGQKSCLVLFSATPQSYTILESSICSINDCWWTDSQVLTSPPSHFHGSGMVGVCGLCSTFFTNRAAVGPLDPKQVGRPLADGPSAQNHKDQ